MSDRVIDTLRHPIEWLRWRIVHLLDRRPDQCWADLACWALNGPKRDNIMPWQPIGGSCRNDFAVNGACYCNKLNREETSQP